MKEKNIIILLDLCSSQEIKKQAIPPFIKKHHNSLYNEVISLSVSGTFLAKAYCYINGIEENPKCFCGQNTNYVSFRKGFSKTCSYKCMGKVEATKQKRKKTTISKYGVEYVCQVDEFKTRSAETMRNKSEEEKLKIHEKKKATSLENYGVEYPNKSQKVREKTRKTNLKKRGVEYPTQSTDVIKLRNKNNFEKYGVEQLTQLPEIREKQLKGLFTRKTYTWKTGEISIVQGYENIILKELEESGYTFDDVKTNSCDIPEFWYTNNNKRKRYFPDIFIPKENLIIEVKSTYTVTQNKEINDLKFQCVKDNGFNFKLEVR